ncbi:hypothetical protein SAMN02745163_02320 [Clostridium cavendishii DSM 21758]|uniref:Uncharacterized protein n=1 Tax=Clostridium cavendishii DSM 21758 TaxID=1121302 RepID=A0A1M6KWR9_9CLOT|nr:hypothetical protein [Clostridium cavendishii]SHJ63407.1 hypothetical protein SAMN02745163_02320 [Clostridium cavendishii DSM 21758]
MKIQESLTCPKCNGVHFTVKRETTFLYSYKLETHVAKENIKNDCNLPFLFDNREQIDNIEYLQCDECGTMYNYDASKDNSNIQLTILQKAIRSDYVNTPKFLG